MNLLIRAFAFLVLVGLFSCSDIRIKQSKNLLDFLAKKGKNDSFQNVLVLTEDGCPNCNRSFALLFEKQITNLSSLFIVSASGTYVDISVFLEYEQQDNVLYDFKGEYKELNITDGTSAIFMNDNGIIDTIIPIRAKGISETLKYISNRINEHEL